MTYVNVNYKHNEKYILKKYKFNICNIIYYSDKAI